MLYSPTRVSSSLAWSSFWSFPGSSYPLNTRAFPDFQAFSHSSSAPISQNHFKSRMDVSLVPKTKRCLPWTPDRHLLPISHHLRRKDFLKSFYSFSFLERKGAGKRNADEKHWLAPFRTPLTWDRVCNPGKCPDQVLLNHQPLNAWTMFNQLSHTGRAKEQSFLSPFPLSPLTFTLS